MTLNISPQFLGDIFGIIIGYAASCSYNADENMYILDVFNVPSQKKFEVEDEIYDLIDMFKQEAGWDLFMAVIVVTEEETRKYYPEKVMPPKTPSPAAICAQPADDDESLAA